ncbi:SCO6880 family protein [Allobranchiibius sp. CTAmp26]|uniref:SCO6880 family protein n=1 Tax=Allobranchiibius sp. CTAmp26 TaxID=2815214 RepID=UPI001AA1B211|nr:SCO6880 family protein [Allobranchiibius sp. CTAmp26]MBO1756475.1 PrgI family protein [Allobranchiibius sp. CTAmp26]
MAAIYRDYSRDRIGWFFGLTGWQAGALAVAVLPPCWAMSRGAWVSVGVFVLLWVALFVITVTPVRGRSSAGWVGALTRSAVGGLLGWTRFRSAAVSGDIGDLRDVDLPGVLQGIQIHDGPPEGRSSARIAVIQDHATKTWAVTASIVHPGIGFTESIDRFQQGTGLSDLLDTAMRVDLIAEVIFVVRTVPDDGAERDLYVRRHRRDGPDLARVVNDQLHAGLSAAGVRTEAFCTLVVPESRLKNAAKETGGGLDGRCRVLYGLMAEIESHLRGGMAMTSVTWLTSPELALACRTGFAPGDRASIIDALAAREHDTAVNAHVPWAMAGPSGADTAIRHYSHDAWNSISSTIKLPVKGAVMGALAPVLTPGEPGERRTVMVCYPIVQQSRAHRQQGNSEWAADVADALRAKAKVKTRAQQRDEAATVRGRDAKLARGNALIRPYAVCTVTAPKTARISEYGRRLDASVRRSGFAPLRLDVAQDAAFAASTIPLGVSLARPRGT